MRLMDFKIIYFLFFIFLFVFFNVDYYYNDLIIIILMILLVSFSFSFFLSLNFLYFSGFLIFLCYYFFFRVNFLLLYFLIEISIFLILIFLVSYGSQVEKISASVYFLFYRVFSGLFFLFSLFKFSFLFERFYNIFILSFLLGFFLVFPFLVKISVYYFHSWLPKVHVESPTIGRVLLASLLLKMGMFGFYLVFFYFSNFKIFLRFFLILGLFFVSSLSLYLSDSKVIIAYSSVIHISLSLFLFLSSFNIGVFTFFVISLGHAVLSGALFLLVGYKYDEKGSRLVYYHCGVFSLLNILSFLLLIINAGLPPSFIFYSEA